MSALELALGSGLNIPIVYNTSGYELPDTLRLLEGIIDIYLPDMRYSDDKMAKKYSDAPGYVEFNRASVLEMQRQAGDLSLDEESIARKGLIIRLLALPGNISGTMDSLRFIHENIGKGAHLSIMSQYYPTFKAYDHVELSRGVTPAEYDNVVDEAGVLGLNNGWIQETPEDFDPKFFGTNIPPKR
jgi:putative pyruvate formate lyase activating enzyme